MGFIIASAMLLNETQQRWWQPKPLDIGWHVAFWNLVVRAPLIWHCCKYLPPSIKVQSLLFHLVYCVISYLYRIKQPLRREAALPRFQHALAQASLWLAERSRSCRRGVGADSECMHAGRTWLLVLRFLRVLWAGVPALGHQLFHILGFATIPHGHCPPCGRTLNLLVMLGANIAVACIIARNRLHASVSRYTAPAGHKCRFGAACIRPGMSYRFCIGMLSKPLAQLHAAWAWDRASEWHLDRGLIPSWPK